MTDIPLTCSSPGPRRADFISKLETESAEEIARLKKELELVKNAVRLGIDSKVQIYEADKDCQNPFRMAEIAIELQIERLRVAEITEARDIALRRLAECYVSIRQKNEMIERIQLENFHGKNDGNTTNSLRPNSQSESVILEQLKAHISTLEASNEELRQIVTKLRASTTLDLPTCPEANSRKVNRHDEQTVPGINKTN